MPSPQPGPVSTWNKLRLFHFTSVILEPMFLWPQIWTLQPVHVSGLSHLPSSWSADSPDQRLGRAFNLHATDIGARSFLVAGSGPEHWRPFSSIPASAHRYERHPQFVTTKRSQTLPRVTWEPKPLLVRNQGLKEDVSPALHGYRQLPSHPVGCSLGRLYCSHSCNSTFLLRRHFWGCSTLNAGFVRLSRNTRWNKVQPLLSLVFGAYLTTQGHTCCKMPSTKSRQQHCLFSSGPFS